MNTDSKKTDQTAVQNPASSSVHPETGRAPWPVSYPPSSEIDLVDLGVMLWRRRWIMLVVFLVFFALTIAGTIIKRPTYLYTTGVRLGSTFVQSSGTMQTLMSASTAADIMQNTDIPQAIQQYLSQGDAVNSAVVRVPKVTATGGGDSVVLSCKAKETTAAPCVAVEALAAKKFIADNAQLVTSAKNQLASLQAQAKLLQAQMDNLNTSAAHYQKQEKTLEQQVAHLQAAGTQAARSNANGAAVASNVILNTEVQRALDNLANVRQQLEVTIPQQKADLAQKLSDNAYNQQLQQQAVSQGSAQMVNPGMRSFQSVGMSRLTVLGLGIIISIILAIVAAFIAAYVEQIRERLAHGA